jgi:hypothetical protein
MTPPPTTTTRSGSAVSSLLVAWSELTTRSPSNSMPGSVRGADPVQMIVDRPRSVWPSTTTEPSAVSRPWPSTTSTLRRLSRPPRPRVSWVTIPLLRALTAGQSTTGVVPSGSRKPKSPACSMLRYTSLAGIQPRCRQVPPMVSRSTIAILSPAEAPYSAAAYPPGPPPSTTTS